MKKKWRETKRLDHVFNAEKRPAGDSKPPV
jgi:hypothetical protein